jgi:hypothetical protein
MLERLNAAVSTAPAFAGARSAGAVVALPTGDGMALAFWQDVLAPVRAAVEIAHDVSGHGIPLRMGIHSGLVQMQMDIANRENIVGEGINTAQRVMDFGDAGHILLSAQYAAWVQHFAEWADLLHPLGEGTAKHAQVISLYSLYGDGFGLATPPSKLEKAARTARASAVPMPVGSKKIALLYRPRLQPDEDVLHTLESRLRDLGHDVFVDHHQKISPAWARSVEEPIRSADAVVAIVSPQSLRSEMLEYEVETAHDQFVKTGKPVLLPVRIGADDPVDGTVASILAPLHFFTWAGPGDDERLIAEILSAITEPLARRSEELKLEPVGGAVPPESPFYARRLCDAELLRAIDAVESILLVKGARQIGKTSLLAQGAAHARAAGRRVAITDFQKFNTAQLASEETFYRLLAATLGRQLGFKYDFASNWDEIFGFGANLNLESFLRELLDTADEPLVWFMDEVDKLFAAPFTSDFFGLVRSWHNSRSTKPTGPWRKLTVVIAYATEAHLFIQDLNQSPFNVGRRLSIEDFDLRQTLDLSTRYGGPLKTYADAEALHALVGGQPFLTRAALDALATGAESVASLLARADADDGPFSDHLKRILISVSRLPEVTEYVRAALSGPVPRDQVAYYRLLSAGVLSERPDGQVGFRCELYRRYLLGHLGGPMPPFGM